MTEQVLSTWRQGRSRQAIIDFVARTCGEGGATTVPTEERVAVFQGASSGLLGSDDMEDAASVLEPGSSAGLLVYENVWAAPFAAALRRGGGQLVASGRIPVQAVLAALDAAAVGA